MSDLAVEPGATPAGPDPASVSDALTAGTAAGDVAPLEPAAPAPAPVEPAVPALDPLELQAELEYMRQQNAALQAWAETQQQAPQQQPGAEPSMPSFVDEFGQFDPDAFTRWQTARDQALLQTLDQRFQQIQAPLTQQAEEAAVAQGEERLNQFLEDIVAQHGAFVADPAADAEARKLVRTLAEQQFPEVAARYGQTPQAAQIALSKAADQVRGILRAAGTQATTAQAATLSTLAAASAEPGGNPGGVPGIPAGESPQDIVARYARAAQALSSNGQ